ncbi:diversity-generating retroelement protein Avd [Geitlerinema sp. P-1104]|uniref:diversity-generating retroelement protein Avd n=1 Tax=Geitlerinema sp. P-1104 TaxID=2546230 RepID=UPI001476BE60|nr:diversity-generating retroelement protein Avd [Geitlerinema sp. P-1104]NMG60199.1 diversity-generating retroelement protein Avd [Geitlerinema sp. P-1104]
MSELSIIQKTYDLVKWYVPILNRLPRSHKFALGERTIASLYDVLEGLIVAQYSSQKLAQLKTLNGKLDVLRYQTRLLVDFGLMDEKRYAYVTQLLAGIGSELGGWIKQQNQRE